jgi:hypothetical protein
MLRYWAPHRTRPGEVRRRTDRGREGTTIWRGEEEYMFTKGTMVRLGGVLLVTGSLLLAGCGSNGNPADSARTGGTTVFQPPNTDFATSLGIEAGPITEEQAKAIAHEATGGNAVAVEREDQDGMDVFGVAIQSSSGNFDVKVRVSDGAVTQIDPDDPGEGETPTDTEDSGAEN